MAPLTRVRGITRTVLTLARPARDPEARRIRSWVWGRLPRVTIRDAFPGIETADVASYRIFDRLVGTNVDPYELICICALERFISARTVLEIGTDEGNTTLNLAANVREGGSVVTIDLSADSPLHRRTPRDVGAQYRDSSFAPRIRQVLGDSATLDWSDLGGPFDLIFLDGSHELEYVRSDTANALAHLSPGGAVIWHDYGSLRAVSRVVDEVARQRPVLALSGTRLAVVRSS